MSATDIVSRNACPCCAITIYNQDNAVNLSEVKCKSCGASLRLLCDGFDHIYCMTTTIQPLIDEITAIVARVMKIPISVVKCSIWRVDEIVTDPLDRVEVFLDIEDRYSDVCFLPAALKGQVKISAVMDVLIRYYVGIAEQGGAISGE